MEGEGEEEGGERGSGRTTVGALRGSGSSTREAGAARYWQGRGAGGPTVTRGQLLAPAWKGCAPRGMGVAPEAEDLSCQCWLHFGQQAQAGHHPLCSTPGPRRLRTEGPSAPGGWWSPWQAGSTLPHGGRGAGQGLAEGFRKHPSNRWLCRGNAGTGGEGVLPGCPQEIGASWDPDGDSQASALGPHLLSLALGGRWPQTARREFEVTQEGSGQAFTPVPLGWRLRLVVDSGAKSMLSKPVHRLHPGWGHPPAAWTAAWSQYLPGGPQVPPAMSSPLTLPPAATQIG